MTKGIDIVLAIGDELGINIDVAEGRVYAEQAKAIEAKYGKAAADNANYGWAVDDDGVATKVYGANGRVIVCTSFDNPTNHEWE